MLEWISLILLIVLGLGLIVAEILFVPGTTFVGVLGFILTGIGVIYCFSVFGNTAGWTTLIISLVVAAMTIVYGVRSGTWQKFSLKGQNRSRVNDETVFDVQVGEQGKTISAMRPMGKVEIRGQLFEARTIGAYLEAGQTVQVKKIDNRIIYIEPIT